MDKKKRAYAVRGNQGLCQIIVPKCPYCKQSHYHHDGTFDGTGEIKGEKIVYCQGSQIGRRYILVEK
jgi:hypothetical protein